MINFLCFTIFFLYFPAREGRRKNMVAVLLGCLLVAVVTGAPATNEKEIELRMPGVQPQVVSTFCCL